MKKITKFVCAIVTSAITFTVANTFARYLLLQNKKEKIDRTFDYTKSFLDEYQDFQDDQLEHEQIKPLMKKENEKNETEIHEVEYNEGEIDFNDVFEKSVENIEINKDKIEFFGEEFSNNIAEKNLEDLEKKLKEEMAFSYVKDLLTGEDYEDSLSEYLDDVEFREYCLKDGLELSQFSEQDNKYHLYDVNCEKNLTSILTEMNNLGNAGFLVDTGEGGTTGSSESLNENILEPEPEGKVYFSPSETRTVEELALVIPYSAVIASLTTIGLVGVAAATFNMPFYGQIASGILLALAIVTLAIFAEYIVPAIAYVIGFFLNMLDGIADFLKKFFVSLSQYIVKNVINLVVENCVNMLNNIGMSVKVAKVMFENSFVVGTSRIALSLLSDGPLVPLGIMDDYLYYAREFNLLHYEYPGEDYDADVEKYGYDWVWAPNELFIRAMVMKGARFELCSRPSRYYNVEQGTIVPGQLRGYARELQLIDKEFNYWWYESSLLTDPLYKCHSIAKRLF